MLEQFIAIFVVIITGAISIVGLVISKENKISEFRQLWINDLRDSLSALSAEFNKINNINSLFIIGEIPSEDDIYNLTMKKSEVILRINNDVKADKDKDEETLTRLINIIYDKLIKNETYDIENDYNQFINAASKVLTKEWKRVKKGENKYIYWSRIFSGLFFLSAVISIIFIVCHISEIWDYITVPRKLWG